MSLLNNLFGPSREEIWKQLCEEIGANYIKGGFWKTDKVQVHVRNWIVTLDIYTVSTGKSHQQFTRIRAPYRNKDGFRFQIYRRNIFTDIGKFFGMQDTEIGDPAFDEDFIIQSNDPAKVGKLLANTHIRSLIAAQPKIKFLVKDDEGWFGVRFPADVDEIIFRVHGIIRDVERLKALFDLFAETLNQLCDMGSAYPYEPDVDL